MIKAILLTMDKIEYVDVDTYTDYYKHLDCSTFDVVSISYLSVDLSLFVDDEGLMKSGNYARDVKGYPNPLAGHIVVTGGSDSEGETLSIPDDFTLTDALDLVSLPKYTVR